MEDHPEDARVVFKDTKVLRKLSTMCLRKVTPTQSPCTEMHGTFDKERSDLGWLRPRSGIPQLSFDELHSEGEKVILECIQADR